MIPKYMNSILSKHRLVHTMPLIIHNHPGFNHAKKAHRPWVMEIARTYIQCDSNHDCLVKHVL